MLGWDEPKTSKKLSGAKKVLYEALQDIKWDEWTPEIAAQWSDTWSELWTDVDTEAVPNTD